MQELLFIAAYLCVGGRWLGFDLADSQGRFICAQFDLSARGIDHPVYIGFFIPYHLEQSGEEACQKRSF